MAVEIRVARPRELADAGRVLIEAYRFDGFTQEGRPYEKELGDTVRRASDAELIVAVEDGVVLGTVTFCQSGSSWAELAGPEEGEFRMLGVSAAARGRGLGVALTTYCIERARELGYSAVVLSSKPEMVAAHGIYTRLGFERAPELDWSPLPEVPLLAFRLRLH
jgi:ribosomal protein S18 acetylase RimI-like enzyme